MLSHIGFLMRIINFKYPHNCFIFQPNKNERYFIILLGYYLCNILVGYNITPEDVKTTEGQVLTYHRIIEAFKFAYAKRTDLADGAFWPNVTNVGNTQLYCPLILL
jgi:hypothetical protein